jgi:hypothetical protein
MKLDLRDRRSHDTAFIFALSASVLNTGLALGKIIDDGATTGLTVSLAILGALASVIWLSLLMWSIWRSDSDDARATS